jgi:DNA-binding NarL/FixJ family response regulator
MRRGATRRSAVVGDRRPLERNLSRFLLEERGFTVAAEAATAEDVVRAVERYRPDVVLVHEDVANEPGSRAIEGIRAASS